MASHTTVSVGMYICTYVCTVCQETACAHLGRPLVILQYSEAETVGRYLC